MGFDLKSMMDDLERILSQEGIKPAKIITQAITALLRWRRYAIECKQIKDSTND